MRLDINYRKKSLKNTNTWRLNNTLLNNQEISEEIKEEIKKYLETNDNENTTTQNLWDAAKAVLSGKFIAIQSYLNAHFGESFYHEWLLNFVKCFFCVYWDDHVVFFFPFVNIVYPIDLQILKHSCILIMNPTWSWCMILFICYWTSFANILLQRYLQ